MLDFAKLANRTPAERQGAELDRDAREIARDRAGRRERSEKTATILLTRDAELRLTVAGGPVFHLRGWDQRARTLAATWRAPDDFGRDRIDDILDRLRAGTALRLDGYWRSRPFNGTRLFEFVTQYLAIGDEPQIP